MSGLDQQKRMSILPQENVSLRRVYDTDKIEKFYNLIRNGKDQKQLFDRMNDDDKRLYEILTKNAVDFNNDEDCDKLIEGIKIFKQHPELIQKEKSYQKFLNELKLEFFPKNHVLFKLGQPGDSYYIVLKGAAQCLIVNPNYQLNQEKKNNENQTIEQKTQEENELLFGEFQSDEQQSQFIQINFPNLLCVKTFMPGESFGEIALMTSSKRTATIVCSEDTYFINLTKQGFDEIMGAYKKQLMEENIQFLEQYPFFNRIATPKLLGLWHYFKQITINNKTMIYNINDPSKYIYFIRKGEVEISKIEQVNSNFLQEKQEQLKVNRQNNLLLYNIHNKEIKANYKPVRIVLLGPNQFFGQHEIVNRQKKRETQAMATCMDTVILQIEKSKLIGILRLYRCLDSFINCIKVKSNWQNDRIKESSSTIKLTCNQGNDKLERLKNNDVKIKIGKPRRLNQQDQSMSRVYSEQQIPSYQLLRQRLEANFSIPSLSTIDVTDVEDTKQVQQEDKCPSTIPSLKDIKSQQVLFTIPDLDEKLQESDNKNQIRPKHLSDDGQQHVKQALQSNIQLLGQQVLQEFQQLQKNESENNNYTGKPPSKLSSFIQELQSNYIIGGTSKQYNKKLFGNLFGHQDYSAIQERKRHSLQVQNSSCINKTQGKFDLMGNNQLPLRLESKRNSEMQSRENNIFSINNYNGIRLQPISIRKPSQDQEQSQQENILQLQQKVLSPTSINYKPFIKQLPIQDIRKPMQVSNH